MRCDFTRGSVGDGISCSWSCPGQCVKCLGIKMGEDVC